MHKFLAYTSRTALSSIITVNTIYQSNNPMFYAIMSIWTVMFMKRFCFRACFGTASLFINFCCVLLQLFALDLNFIFVLQVYCSPYILYSVTKMLFLSYNYTSCWFYVSYSGVYFWKSMCLFYFHINNKEILSYAHHQMEESHVILRKTF